MLIDITRLINNYESNTEINTTITFPKEYISTTDIRSIKPVLVTGYITKDGAGTFAVNINIKGEMILPCAITLQDVIYPFDINYESDVNEEEENLKKTGNYIDILPIVWENIVTEIPLRVTVPNATIENLKGDGWEVITENTKKENQFEVLKDLLKEKEDE